MNKTKGKHMKNTRGKYAKTYTKTEIAKKILSPLTIVLTTCVISGTSAYLMKNNSIKNEFVIGEVKPEIIETFDEANKTKNDVYIKNSGNVPIYIRSAIIISWKDKDGKILEIKPEENIDYSISFSTSSNWMKSSDGYYYYKKAIEEKTNTDILIEECIQIKNYEEKKLEVSIATQGIQAEPSKAVIEAWNVDVVDNVLVLKE